MIRNLLARVTPLTLALGILGYLFVAAALVTAVTG